MALPNQYFRAKNPRSKYLPTVSTKSGIQNLTRRKCGFLFCGKIFGTKTVK